jgi:hypothetical protein
MSLSLSICFLICFLVELLLTVICFVYDITGYLKAKDRVQGYSYALETTLMGFFGIAQAGLSVTGIIGAVAQLSLGRKVKWFEAIIICNLQLSVGSKVRIFRCIS